MGEMDLPSERFQGSKANSNFKIKSRKDKTKIPLKEERDKFLLKVNELQKDKWKYPKSQRYVFKEGNSEKGSELIKPEEGLEFIKPVLQIDNGWVYDTWGSADLDRTLRIKCGIKVEFEQQYVNRDGIVVGEKEKESDSEEIGWGLRSTLKIEQNETVARMVLPELVIESNPLYNNYLEFLQSELVDGMIIPTETVFHKGEKMIIDRFLYEAYKADKFNPYGVDFKPIWFLANSPSPIIKDDKSFYNFPEENVQPVERRGVPSLRAKFEIDKDTIVLFSYIGDHEKEIEGIPTPVLQNSKEKELAVFTDSEDKIMAYATKQFELYFQLANINRFFNRDILEIETTLKTFYKEATKYLAPNILGKMSLGVETNEENTVLYKTYIGIISESNEDLLYDVMELFGIAYILGQSGRNIRMAIHIKDKVYTDEDYEEMERENPFKLLINYEDVPDDVLAKKSSPLPNPRKPKELIYFAALGFLSFHYAIKLFSDEILRIDLMNAEKCSDENDTESLQDLIWDLYGRLLYRNTVFDYFTRFKTEEKRQKFIEAVNKADILFPRSDDEISWRGMWEEVQQVIKNLKALENSDNEEEITKIYEKINLIHRNTCRELYHPFGKSLPPQKKRSVPRENTDKRDDKWLELAKQRWQKTYKNKMKGYMQTRNRNWLKKAKQKWEAQYKERQPVPMDVDETVTREGYSLQQNSGESSNKLREKAKELGISTRGTKKDLIQKLENPLPYLPVTRLREILEKYGQKSNGRNKTELINRIRQLSIPDINEVLKELQRESRNLPQDEEQPPSNLAVSSSSEDEASEESLEKEEMADSEKQPNFCGFYNVFIPEQENDEIYAILAMLYKPGDNFEDLQTRVVSEFAIFDKLEPELKICTILERMGSFTYLYYMDRIYGKWNFLSNTAFEGAIVYKNNHFATIKKVGDCFYSLDLLSRNPNRNISKEEAIEIMNQNIKETVFVFSSEGDENEEDIFQRQNEALEKKGVTESEEQEKTSQPQKRKDSILDSVVITEKEDEKKLKEGLAQNIRERAQKRSGENKPSFPSKRLKSQEKIPTSRYYSLSEDDESDKEEVIITDRVQGKKKQVTLDTSTKGYEESKNCGPYTGFIPEQGKDRKCGLYATQAMLYRPGDNFEDLKERVISDFRSIGVNNCNDMSNFQIADVLKEKNGYIVKYVMDDKHFLFKENFRGAIVLKNDHFVTIKKVKNCFYNLDSLSRNPNRNITAGEALKIMMNKGASTLYVFKKKKRLEIGKAKKIADAREEARRKRKREAQNQSPMFLNISISSSQGNPQAIYDNLSLEDENWSLLVNPVSQRNTPPSSEDESSDNENYESDSSGESYSFSLPKDSYRYGNNRESGVNSVESDSDSDSGRSVDKEGNPIPKIDIFSNLKEILEQERKKGEETQRDEATPITSMLDFLKI